MRDFLTVLAFELRLQCRSALFACLCLLFFAIHLLTMAQAGINIVDNELVHYNAPFLIFRIEVVLNLFGLLPALIFVVNAATRDQSLSTTELFYATPVGKLGFLLGRLAGGIICALLVVLAGTLGMIAGTFMPWLDPQRVAAFAWQPYVVSYFLLVVPNLLVFSVFSYGVARLTRSVALSFAVPLLMVAFALFINGRAGPDSRDWLSIFDPFGALALERASRYWSLAQLNSLLPVALLPANRTLWLGLATLVLALTCWRFQLQLAPAGRRWWQRRGNPAVLPVMPTVTHQEWRCSFGARATLAQFTAQWRMDLRAVLLSPLFWLVMFLALASTVSEIRNSNSAVMNLPNHPLTSQMLHVMRIALLQFVLLVLIFFSALLMHREREYNLHEILGAAPYPDWMPLLSKVLTLCGVMMLLQLGSLLVSMGWQALHGHYDFELGVYLQALMVNNGFYFCMLGVLACVLQVVVPGKWSGMVLVAVVVVGLLVLPLTRFDHLLYSFRLPYIQYTDMNGWGQFLGPVYTLVAYWGMFCVLLLVAGHLVFPRGAYSSLVARVREAPIRFTPAVRVTTLVAATLFVVLGGWIFYNTNILNVYRSKLAGLQLQAGYELRYAAWNQKPAPTVTAIDLAFDLYPHERRFQARGRVTLRNNNASALHEIFVTAPPGLSMDELVVEGGMLVTEDREQNVFLFKLPAALQPGAETAMTWTASRRNRGFVNNSQPDGDVVDNGSFLAVMGVMPVPFYAVIRELTDTADRKRMHLPPAPRLPALGDPAWLGTLDIGIDNRPEFHLVFSTDVDQVAVSPGNVQRQWQENGRRYFEYKSDVPTRPALPLVSARYQVARDNWNGVAIEVYHDAKHPWNVPVMLHTARTALEYFSREFAPYPLAYFRIAEYPGYEDHAQAHAGMITYTETVGFMADLSNWAPLDYGTAHELSHQWWGGMAYGARMQGRKILNEGLAEYSSWMLFKQLPDQQWVHKIVSRVNGMYLTGRKDEHVGEVPVIFAADQQGHLTYGKSALVLFALQELIGAEQVHLALRRYLDNFGMKGPPYPTSRDLVNELRAVAGPEYQQFITDQWERIMLYDVQVKAASVKPVGLEYEVTMDVKAHQFEADGVGNDREVPVDTWFQIVVFPDSQQDLMVQVPLYKAQRRLNSGVQRITLRVPERPGSVAVDPYHLMIDKRPQDNVFSLTRQ